MQPCSREMQGMKSVLNPTTTTTTTTTRSQIHVQELQQQIQQTSSSSSPATTNDDFLEQMLSCSWAEQLNKSPWDLNPPATTDETNGENVSIGFHHHNLDDSVILASKLRQYQISASTAGEVAAAKMMLQQQLMLAARAQSDILDSIGGGGDLYNNGFDSGSINGSNGGVASNQPHHFHQLPITTIQQQSLGCDQGGALIVNQQQQQPLQPQPQQPKQQRVRARRGQATDPHSIAERLRRERIAERMKALQELVPNANKTDKASMLDEIIDYVKFLQLQVKVLSMSRLGGAAAVAPLVADMSSEGGGDCIQASANAGGSLSRNPNSNGNETASSNDSLTVTEHQVAKLMEEDMGSAMQYLQGKGLCLMPISLATAISTATTSHASRNPAILNPLLQSSGAQAPSSPSMSVLTVQSATMANGGADASAKDAASVSEP